MGVRNQKRPRNIEDDGDCAGDNRAECPFSVTVLRESVTKEVRKSHRATKRKEPVQTAPFQPSGKLKTHASLDVRYRIEPKKQWNGMTRYSSFLLNGVRYLNNDFVYVANDMTVRRKKKMARKDGAVSKRLDEHWVARILEIKAADPDHVYARVYWMYRPDELPAALMGGRMTAAGRHPYHGMHELIASNHMDIINVISVAMPADVLHWNETEDEVHKAFYWRQALDLRTCELSTLAPQCYCSQPSNPDKLLVECTNDTCNAWLHYDCLLDDVLTRVYDNLGTDRAYVPPPPKNQEVGQGDFPGELDIKHEFLDGVERDFKEGTPLSTTTTLVSLSRGQDSIKLCDGLFAAKLKSNPGTTLWEMEDLRMGVKGGKKTWTEKAYCLMCGWVLK